MRLVDASRALYLQSPASSVFPSSPAVSKELRPRTPKPPQVWPKSCGWKDAVQGRGAAQVLQPNAKEGAAVIPLPLLALRGPRGRGRGGRELTISGPDFPDVRRVRG